MPNAQISLDEARSGSVYDEQAKNRRPGKQVIICDETTEFFFGQNFSGSRPERATSYVTHDFELFLYRASTDYQSLCQVNRNGGNSTTSSRSRPCLALCNDASDWPFSGSRHDHFCNIFLGVWGLVRIINIIETFCEMKSNDAISSLL